MHVPNKDVHRLIESCAHSVGLVFVSQPIYRIISTTWGCLYSTSWYSFGMGMVRLFEASLEDSWQDDFFTNFLPAMAFDHDSMTYKLGLLKNHWVHNLLAMCSSTQTYWQWARPKFHSLLSAHLLIGAYFLSLVPIPCPKGGEGSGIHWALSGVRRK